VGGAHSKANTEKWSSISPLTTFSRRNQEKKLRAAAAASKLPLK
jgi:hypothetical protein